MARLCDVPVDALEVVDVLAVASAAPAGAPEHAAKISANPANAAGSRRILYPFSAMPNGKNNQT
jgi:hypothetical protein